MALFAPTRTAGRPAGGTAAATRPAPVPGKRLLLGASLMVMLGSFMPWLDTPFGAVLGVHGAGLWTFYACLLGFAALVVPVRALAIGQAALLAVTAVGLTTWQLVHVLSLVGTAGLGMSGWMPGPGLVLVFGGGVAAGSAAWKMHRATRA